MVNARLYTFATLRCPLLTLALALVMTMAGCGLAWDMRNAVKSTQLPPSPLFTADFYLTATPEQVREEIGKGSLQGQAYSKRHFIRAKRPENYTETEMRAKGVFVPTSGVLEEEPDRPIDLALLHSPHTEVIGILLDAGADISWDTLQLLRQGRLRPEMADAILTRGGEELVCDMVEFYGTKKDWNAFEQCFSTYSAMPDCTPLYRTLTPLMTAASDNNMEFVRRLLAHGANVNKADSAGQRALNYALRNGHADMAAYLISQGADCAYVTAKQKGDLESVTLLDDARAGGITDGKLLKTLAAAVPLSEEAEHAALAMAVKYGDKELLDILLERGAVFADDEKYTVGKKNDPAARKMHAFLEEQGVRTDYED